MNIILSILAFGVLIIFHEFGHFLLAKLNGIGVIEFSVGMGPRLLSTVRGGTRYSLKAVPFGGSCMMVGEDEESDREDSFGSKSVWARMSVVLAGPFFNFILAFLLALIVIGCVGIDRPVLSGVMEGYPAQEAGMQSGDVIRELNGKKIRVYRDVSLYLMLHPGETLDVVYERDGADHRAVITPRYSEENGGYLMGIQVSGVRERLGPVQTVGYSLNEVGFWIKYTFLSLKMMVTGQVSAQDVSGPVGLVSTMSDVMDQSRESGYFYMILNLLNFCILLSANLGVINLLPLPALDGGRFFFQVIEAVRGRPVDPERENMVHAIGFMLLMGLMVVILFNDIIKLIG